MQYGWSRGGGCLWEKEQTEFELVLREAFLVSGRDACCCCCYRLPDSRRTTARSRLCDSGQANSPSSPRFDGHGMNCTPMQ